MRSTKKVAKRCSQWKLCIPPLPGVHAAPATGCQLHPAPVQPQGGAQLVVGEPQHRPVRQLRRLEHVGVLEHGRGPHVRQPVERLRRRQATTVLGRVPAARWGHPKADPQACSTEKLQRSGGVDRHERVILRR